MRNAGHQTHVPQLQHALADRHRSCSVRYWAGRRRYVCAVRCSDWEGMLVMVRGSTQIGKVRNPMEQHAVASNGEYYIYNINTAEMLGPFFPKDRTERIHTFVENTINRAEDGWKGAYRRRLPKSFRQQLK